MPVALAHSLFQFLHQLTPFIQLSALGVPPDIFWIPALVLLLLGVLALEDARSGHIPDSIIAFGMILLIAAQGYYVSVIFAVMHLLLGLGLALLLWAINKAWYMWRRHDALGMGDAKWTMVAATCFGIGPAAFAWFVGAWLALLWIGLCRLFAHKITRVHFAPFLFLGLIAGIWWIRLKV